MSKKNKVEETKYVELCQGVQLSPAFFEKKENRVYILLIKGLIVYLLSMGSIGFYLSALQIEYNEVLCHIVIGAMALLCAFLYYRLWVENTGYFILFALFGLTVYTFRAYINSGFYAIVNITVDHATQYFNIDIQKLYNEQIEDRYVTITFVCLFIGIVLDILLNVYISRRMQYVNALFIIMSLNLIPLYFTEEPDMFYVVMMLAGMAMAYVYKSGRHYSPQVNVKRDNIVFTEKGGKKKVNKPISYVYDVKAHIQAGLIAVIFTIVIVMSVSVIKPKEKFNIGYEGNKYKDLTMAGVSTLLLDGWSGFYRQKDHIGGVQGGRLGNVSTVRLDHQTDLVVSFTPYSQDRVYLKSFTGISYIPYENEWVNIENVNTYDTSKTPEADALKEAYENNAEGSAYGVMEIEPVGVGYNSRFLPYYTADADYKELVDKYFFYPRNDINDTLVTASYYGGEMPFSESDLYVPEENIDAISSLCDEIEWGTSKEEKVYNLALYFQENIPYTIKPGKTPKNRDFVNYFLEDNRKGYCTHFATTAVLVFRYMGIPARYVEGYVIDYNQILDGELVEDAKYEDYYDGYSELGKTALVKVNVTDADAHAWVEVYISGKGWMPVEVTPTGEEEELDDFWEMFDEVVGEQSDQTGGNGAGNIVNFKVPKKVIQSVFYVVAGAVVLLILAVLTAIFAKRMIYFARCKNAGINDRLIMKYSAYYKKMCRKDKELKKKINYSEQIHYLIQKKNNADSGIFETGEMIISILEKAGFSNVSISEEDYQTTINWLNNVIK